MQVFYRSRQRDCAIVINFGADTADALKLRARNFRAKVARIKLF
jgi:hypothetical protein